MWEKRRYYRKSVELPLEFTLNEAGERVPGTCRDSTLEGMHIETPKPAPFGASVTLLVQLTGMRGQSALPAVVRWTKDQQMGVQFGLLGARETYAITEMLAR